MGDSPAEKRTPIADSRNLDIIGTPPERWLRVGLYASPHHGGCGNLASLANSQAMA
jgi:hypothetical protein